MLDAAAVLSGSAEVIRLRLIVRLIMEIVGLIADLQKRAAKGKKASKRRLGKGELEREIDALIADLRRLERMT
jgi:hypothetical protein